MLQIIDLKHVLIHIKHSIAMSRIFRYVLNISYSMALPWDDPMYGLPMECPEEERQGSLSRALIDVSQNLFQHHFEVYFENPSLKVNGKREAWLVCSSMTLPQLRSILRVTKVIVGETKVVSETFCCWFFYTWWDSHDTYLRVEFTCAEEAQF